jgi:hypothetical protein
MIARPTTILNALGLAVLTAISLPACKQNTPTSEPISPAPTVTTPSWLKDVTAESGLSFSHESGAKGDRFLPEITGPGSAVFDANGDGRLDIYLANGNVSLDGTAPDPSIKNRLFLQDETGRFVDRTNYSGLGDTGYAMGVAVGDVDGDGDPDVYIMNVGLDRLYRNNGKGRFEDVTADAGVSCAGWSCSAAFLDYDRDGRLDLFVTQYTVFDTRTQCAEQAGRKDYCGPKAYEAAVDILLHNEGGGRFRDVTRTAGISGSAAAGLGVSVADFNNDGWVDMYVANDGYANHLWINQQDGTFVDHAVILGAAYNMHGQPEASMGVVAADFDHDLKVDLFMTHLAAETNTYYRNLGSLGFNDMTGVAGLAAPSVASTGFGTVAFDLELDGDLDLLVANGRVLMGESAANTKMPVPWNHYVEPNQVFLGKASSFESTVRHCASFTAPMDISRGLIAADIDSDGDLDVLVNNVNGPARLYRNDAPRQGHWLAIDALTAGSTGPAIGAEVVVQSGAVTRLHTVGRSGSYVSSGPATAHFGLGAAAEYDHVTVRWPDGTRERFAGGAVDRRVVLRQNRGTRLP